MNLPIAERELRVAARSPRVFRGRVITAVVFGAITVWMFWFTTRIAPLGTIAAQTYAFITHIALIMCMFSATATADSLSSEKRNGTMGLLFLTDLNGADIVFGKLAAVGLLTFYSLLGAIPMLALPLLMGGISGQSVFRTALTLLNSLFFALAMGLWVSARSLDAKRANNSAVWIVISFLWLLPGLSELLRYRFHWFALADALYLLSPTYQQDHSNPYGLGMRSEHYWLSLGITHVLAWFALWRASATLPRAWQDRPVAPETGRFKRMVHEHRFGSPEVRAAFRRRLLNINPVFWLSSRDKSGPFWSWFFIGITIAAWIVLWIWVKLISTNVPPFIVFGIPSVFAMILGLRMRACALAGETIARDRFSGALELLLSSDLSVKDVVRGQWLTFRRVVLKPAIFSILIGTLLFIGFLKDAEEAAIANIVVFFVGAQIVYVFDLIASVWTGMWVACISKTPAGAPGQALVRLMLLPWAAFVSVATFCGIVGIGEQAGFIPWFSIWWLLSMSNNLLWIVRSRQNFYGRLRLVAAERYQPPAPKSRWWRRRAAIPNGAHTALPASA